MAMGTDQVSDQMFRKVSKLQTVNHQPALIVFKDHGRRFKTVSVDYHCSLGKPTRVKVSRRAQSRVLITEAARKFFRFSRSIDSEGRRGSRRKQNPVASWRWRDRGDTPRRAGGRRTAARAPDDPSRFPPRTFVAVPTPPLPRPTARRRRRRTCPPLTASATGRRALLRDEEGVGSTASARRARRKHDPWARVEDLAGTKHYDVLGVPRDADARAIKRAYREMARTCHPDKGGSDAAFAAVRTAFETLGHRVAPRTTRWPRARVPVHPRRDPRARRRGRHAGRPRAARSFPGPRVAAGGAVRGVRPPEQQDVLRVRDWFDFARKLHWRGGVGPLPGDQQAGAPAADLAEKELEKRSRRTRGEG